MNITRPKLISDMLWHYRRNLNLMRRDNGKFIRAQEVRMEKKIDAILKKQMRWVADGVKNVPGLSNNGVHYDRNTLDDQISAMLSGMPGKTDLTETILIYSGVLMDKGANSIIRTSELRKFGISFTLKHPAAIKFLSNKKTLELSNGRGNIDSRTKASIKAILLDAISEGKSYTATAQLIKAQGEHGVFSYARAELIAVREAGVAYEYGKQTPLKEFIAKNPDRQIKKNWNTSGDNDVTPECQQNQDVSPIGFNETFPNDGAQQTAPRSGNPRCRCWTTYEII